MNLIASLRFSRLLQQIKLPQLMLLGVLYLGVSTTLQAADDPFLNLLDNSAATTETQVLDGKEISTDLTTQDDEKIQQRLAQLYQDIDSFRGLRVSVKNSIVTITGQLDSNTSATRAIQYARQVKGVIGINNKITVDRSISRRLASTWTRIIGIAKDAIGSLPMLLIAMLVLFIFWWLGRWLAKRQSFYRRISANYFISNLLGQIVNIVVLGAGFLVALVILDATSLVKTLLGAAGIVGLAIGFAVRDTVENYIASILLSIRNPFSINDLVRIDTQEGRVVSLTSRATMLLSLDGNYIRIPNATVFKAIIVNYSSSPERRFSFDLSIDSNQNILQAQKIARQALKMAEGVLTEPSPAVLVQDLIEDKVILRLQAWVDQDKYSLSTVRSRSIREVKQAFEEAGIFSIEQPLIEPSLPKEDLLEQVESDDLSAEQATTAKVLAAQVNNEENLLTPKAPKEHRVP